MEAHRQEENDDREDDGLEMQVRSDDNDDKEDDGLEMQVRSDDAFAQRIIITNSQAASGATVV